MTLIVAVIALAVALGCVFFGHWLSQKSEQERFARDFIRRRRDFASTLALEVEGVQARLNAALKADYHEPPAVIQESYFTRAEESEEILTFNPVAGATRLGGLAHFP